MEKYGRLNNSIFKIVEKKDGKYILKCNEILNLQPVNIITLNCYYVTLKRDETFKRKIIRVENLQGNLIQANEAIMVIEHIGIFPCYVTSHENNLKFDSEYSRREQFPISHIENNIDITENKLPSKDDHQNSTNAAKKCFWVKEL